jgi:DNA-binding NarL/FixJ family response regulator
MKPIRILLVDDHAIIRKSFLLLLSKIPHVKVIGECSDGVEVLPFIKRHQVDVIFMDINMKLMGGLEATKEVKQYYPMVKVIGLSSEDDVFIIQKMKANGADSFISKFDANKESIKAELNQVLNL